MPASSRRQSPGFTLVELIIVIMIIGILVAIAIPAIYGMRRKAKEADARSVVKGALAAIAQLFDDNKAKWPFYADEEGDGFTGYYAGTSDETSIIVALQSSRDHLLFDIDAWYDGRDGDDEFGFPYLKEQRLEDDIRLSPFYTPYKFEWRIDEKDHIYYTVWTNDDSGNKIGDMNIID